MLTSQYFSRSNSKSRTHGGKEKKKSDTIILKEYHDRENAKIALENSHLRHQNKIISFYLLLSEYSRKLLHGTYEAIFDWFMVVVILVASIEVGMQTYNTFSNSNSLIVIDYLILSIFSLEFILKVVSEGLEPLNYFRGPEWGWNTMDFIILILCMPFFDYFMSGKASSFRIMTRLFRLSRMIKIFRKVSALQVIVDGLIASLRSIGYIAILMFMIFYLFGVIGVFLFKSNDPFNFRSVHIAMLSLFVSSTFDSWGDVFRISAYGCDNYSAGIYLKHSEVDNATWASLPQFYKCLEPKAQPIITSVFWFAFVVISSFIILSLFISIITMNMEESLSSMKAVIEEDTRREKLLKNEQELNEIHDEVPDKEAPKHRSKGPWTVLRRIIIAKKWMFSHKIIPSSTKPKSGKQSKRLRKINEMRRLLQKAWSGKLPEEAIDNEINMESETRIEKLKNKISNFCNRVLEHSIFNLFILVIIMTSSVLIGVEADYFDMSNQKQKNIMNGFENMFFVVFLGEIIIRYAAVEFDTFEYLSSRWNVFDLLIVISSKLPGGGTIVNVLRLFRLLRVLKLVKAFPKLALVVSTLVLGLRAIGYIGVVISLVFYVFSIMAVIIFQENDPFRFGNLHLAFFTLFDVATLDNWGSIMYTQIYGCDVYPSPLNINEDIQKFCTTPNATGFIAALFFVVFVIIGALVLFTLFIGAVTTTMEEISIQQNIDEELDNYVRSLCKEYSISKEKLEVYRRVFSILDIDGGGTIEKDELAIGLKCVGIVPTHAELDDWMNRFDENKDGVIDFAEFVVFFTNIEMMNSNREPPDGIPILGQMEYHPITNTNSESSIGTTNENSATNTGAESPISGSGNSSTVVISHRDTSGRRASSLLASAKILELRNRVRRSKISESSRKMSIQNTVDSLAFLSCEVDSPRDANHSDVMRIGSNRKDARNSGSIHGSSSNSDSDSNSDSEPKKNTKVNRQDSDADADVDADVDVDRDTDPLMKTQPQSKTDIHSQSTHYGRFLDINQNNDSDKDNDDSDSDVGGQQSIIPAELVE